MVLHAEPTEYGRLKVARALARSCRHGRNIALKYAFPRIFLSGHKAFSLIVHKWVASDATAGMQWPLSCPFEYTTSVCMDYDDVHAAPLIALAASAFPRLTTLDFCFSPVGARRHSWDEFSRALRQLSVLGSVETLRTLRMYLFVAHDYVNSTVDLTGLNALQQSKKLDHLVLRMSGGIVLSASKPILPSAIRRLRLSVQVLAMYSLATWSSAGVLECLEIEEERVKEQLRRRYLMDAARDLSAGLSAGRDNLAATLRSVRLLGVYLDVDGIQLLGELKLLTQLDLHPAMLELLSSDRRFLVERAETGRQDMAYVRPDSFTRAAEDDMTRVVAVLRRGELKDLRQTLMYLFSRLGNLRVLHVGGFSETYPALVQIEEDGGEVWFIELLELVGGFLPRSMSFAHFGPAEQETEASYVHVPTCPLCAGGRGGGGRERAAACRSLEGSLRRARGGADDYPTTRPFGGTLRT